MPDKTDARVESQVLTAEKRDLARLTRTAAPAQDLAVAGVSMRRTDDVLKVTGTLQYAADMPQEGFLHGKILRSPHPHALIKAIRTDKAKALPGVAAVLTAADVPGRNGFGAIIPDQPVICGDKVRFVGDGVALVAAESEALANQALALIEVDYEVLPAVFDPRDAMAPGAPAIHEKGNLISSDKLRKGDVEQGFADADVIMERTYQVPFLEHAYMEPDVVMAVPQDDGVMLVKGPMQAPFTVRRNIAPVLGVPINRVRCVQVHMGGGFGGKEDSPIDLGCRAAVLAAHTKRPVRISLEREEVTVQTCKRHPMIMHVKIGAKNDGSLTAFEGVIYDEQGAYASLGPRIPPAGGSHVHAMVMMAGPYEIPNVKVDAHLIYTNHPYGGAFRGFGAPQVHIAHEQAMDELALMLGMDPVSIRRKNAFKLGSATATGQVLEQSVGLRETLEACVDHFNWEERFKDNGFVPGTRKRRGVGVGMGWYRTSIGTMGDGCGASVHVHEDGTALLFSGITEMGQGAFTVLPQICAEELGINLEDVRLVKPDTDMVPESGPTVGSRSTTLMGNAIIMAARQIKESLIEKASEMLMVPGERLVFKSRRVYDRDNPTGKSLEFKQVATACMVTGRRLIGQGWWSPPLPSLDLETGQGNPYHVYTYSTHMAEVLVDVDTGEVEVTDYVAAFDVGKAINPRALEGQIEGGVAMGLGYALMEEVAIIDGFIQNLSLQNYLIPTSLDVPAIKSVVLEMTNQMGPYGAKGIGEMPNIPATPAILNAIAHACGGRVRSLPADCEKVFWAMREAQRPPRS